MLISLQQSKFYLILKIIKALKLEFDIDEMVILLLKSCCLPNAEFLLDFFLNQRNYSHTYLEQLQFFSAIFLRSADISNHNPFDLRQIIDGKQRF